jgi:hypothetical protein
MPPEKAAEIADGRMTFANIPSGFIPPPPYTPDLIEAVLQPPQQRKGDHLPLEGAQHRLLRPCPALFHTEALLMIAEPIFSAEAGGRRRHHLRCRQIQCRRHREPELLIPVYHHDQDMGRGLWPADRPAALQLLVLETAYPSIDPRVALLLGGR